MADNVKILGTAGSIRKASFNRSALRGGAEARARRCIDRDFRNRRPAWL